MVAIYWLCKPVSIYLLKEEISPCCQLGASNIYYYDFYYYQDHAKCDLVSSGYLNSDYIAVLYSFNLILD